jgi:probable FeS assembly SUF system protein SufT
MSAKVLVIVKRDIDVITIPYGTKTKLPAGSQVHINERYGGNFTVMTDQGQLVRVEAADADAIGETATAEQPVVTSGAFDEKLVWEQMKTVFDPEIPVNIVDLGLVYACEPKKLDDGTYRVEIQMTMTAPGCGMGEILKQDVQRKVAALPGVKELDVRIVFEPAWTMAKMSEAARLQLGLE